MLRLRKAERHHQAAAKVERMLLLLLLPLWVDVASHTARVTDRNLMVYVVWLDAVCQHYVTVSPNRPQIVRCQVVTKDDLKGYVASVSTEVVPGAMKAGFAPKKDEEVKILEGNRVEIKVVRTKHIGVKGMTRENMVIVKKQVTVAKLRNIRLP